MHTLPPSRSYLMAFDRRFSRTCFEPLTVGYDIALEGRGGHDRDVARIGERRDSSVTLRRSTGSSEIPSSPDSRRDISSTSLSSVRRWVPLLTMWPRLARWWGVQPVRLQQLREAEDRVERCSQLVAHAREVFALRLVGALSLLGASQLRADVLVQAPGRHAAMPAASTKPP